MLRTGTGLLSVCLLHATTLCSRLVQAKTPAGLRPPGDYCGTRSGTRHLDPHHVLKDSFQTAENCELVDLLGHLLQGLQLLEAEQRWVLIHEPRGVEQRPGRRRFLTALDEV